MENLPLPEGMNEETMQNAIMFRCGMLETFYPDPPTLQKMVNIWFTQNQVNFTKLWEAYNLVYNPIGNVDMYTDNSRHANSDSQQTDSRDRTENLGEDISETETYTRTNDIESTRDRNQTTDTTTEDTVSAFNSDSYQPDRKQTSNSTVDENITDSTNQNIDDVTNKGKDRSQTTTENEGFTSNKSETEVNVFDEHRRGSDGRFSFQQMIEQELELWGDFSIYEYIAEKFEKAFCVLCY